MKPTVYLSALIAASSAFAQDTRQLDAHEHGVGTLNIAMDGPIVEMAFEVPGADIVGFEYAAESAADLAAIDQAIATLSAPLDLFVMPAAAGCSVVLAEAALEGDEAHDDHDDDAHADHDDHAHDDHDDHDDHADHADDVDEADHTEFHAEYTLNCDTPEALTEITFSYFDHFSNALEVEVQIVTASGAQAFEVGRDAPRLELGR